MTSALDVRMAAATALGQYPGREAYRGLTTALDDRAYGVSRAAREHRERRALGRSLPRHPGHGLGQCGCRCRIRYQAV